MLNAMANHEMDLYILTHDIELKPDDIDIPEIPEIPRRRVHDRFLAQERAKSRKSRTAKLKKSRIKKSWESVGDTGKDILWYDWRVLGGGTVEDPWRLQVWKVTERKDTMSVRKALAKTKVQLNEYA